MKSRGPLVGLQFISYAQLAYDILMWSSAFPKSYYRAVIGIPRSGLTCAHMLSVHLNSPCTALHAREFRQSTGRPIVFGQGPYLIVDDTVSYGTTMKEVRDQVKGISAEFAAVYVRDGARSSVDHWFGRHEEPDWLVITEWNWNKHQDAEYIAVTADVGELGYDLNPKFDCVYQSTRDALAYRHSLAAVLFAVHDCQALADECGKPVIDARAMKVYSPGYHHGT